MWKFFKKCAIVAAFLISPLSPASEPQHVVVSEGFKQVGVFTGLPEISGMAFSRTNPERIYLHNDSGDSSRFFIATINGSAQSVSLSGQSHRDYEDMSVGPCGNGNDCLYIADVGDNDVRRTDYKIIVVQETNFGSAVAPFKSLKLKYSDGRSHNVEAMAVHPIAGDLFLTTKVDENPHVYKVSAEVLSSTPTGGTITAVDIGTLDLELLFPGANETITGMAISPTGSHFALLSYTQIYEFEFDLAAWRTVWTSQLDDVKRVQYKPVKLQQQEAIAYNKDGALFFTTETNSSKPAVIMQVPRVVEIPTGPPLVITEPSVVGTYIVGKTLTALPGTWKGALPLEITFQWKRCNLAGKSCDNISQAKSNTYVLTEADVNHTVKVRVNAKNAEGTDFASTTPILVAPILP